MFTNLTFYRFSVTGTGTAAADLPEFVECLPSQEQSVGFVPPRGEAHGPLVEAGIMRVMFERKTVPGDAVRRRADQRANEIEQVTGRKPGRKEIRDIRENIKQEMLPHAFPKRSAVWVWLDSVAGRIVIDSTSSSTVDTIVSLLVKHVDGFTVREVHTATSPTAAMSTWLDTQEPPVGWTVDRECELKATDASRAAIRYAHHPLDLGEIRQHIAEGKLPTRLALTWDDRVSFVLTEGMQLRKLTFQDGVFEGSRDVDTDSFDGDVALSTGELRRLIPALLEALDGEVDPVA